MDLAMVKQEQGETLRKYMRRFFDKRATVVDVSDKEVIDLFQDGLYHHRCRMDLLGPTTSVGTRTDYSVGPWDYPTCAARYLMA
jgi:hypothetical protein